MSESVQYGLRKEDRGINARSISVKTYLAIDLNCCMLNSLLGGVRG